MNLSPSGVSFTVRRDELAELYDVYFIDRDRVLFARVTRPEEGDVAVTLTDDLSSTQSGRLLVYAYDRNLAAYFTYNINIKPNLPRER